MCRDTCGRVLVKKKITIISPSGQEEATGKKGKQCKNFRGLQKTHIKRWGRGGVLL